VAPIYEQLSKQHPGVRPQGCCCPQAAAAPGAPLTARGSPPGQLPGFGQGRGQGQGQGQGRAARAARGAGWQLWLGQLPRPELGAWQSVCLFWCCSRQAPAAPPTRHRRPAPSLGDLPQGRHRQPAAAQHSDGPQRDCRGEAGGPQVQAGPTNEPGPSAACCDSASKRRRPQPAQSPAIQAPSPRSLPRDAPISPLDPPCPPCPPCPQTHSPRPAPPSARRSPRSRSTRAPPASTASAAHVWTCSRS
jgi:hypothetical protein